MAISNIGKGAIISYVAIFLNIAISFLYTPWMLKQIGTSDYGLYSLILSFISYFTLDFGLSFSIARFITKYRASGEDYKVENVMGIVLKMFLLLDAVILLCLFVSYFFIAEIFTGLTPDEIDRLKVLYIIASTFSVLSFLLKPLDGALTAYEYFVPSKLIDMTYKVGSVFLVVIALLLGGNIFILVLINSALLFLVHLYKFYYWHCKTKLTPNLKHNDSKERREILSFSGWTFLISMAHRFRINLIPSVLGIFSNSEQIAIFALGTVMQNMSWTLSSALNGLLFPKVTRLSQENNTDALQDLLIRVGRIQLFIVFFIYTSFLVCGKLFVRLWVGETFSDVYYIVLFLTFANIIENTLRVAEDKIYADGKIRYMSRVVFSTSLIGILLSCMFAGRYGALGCSICSGIALLLTHICYLHVYKKRVKINVVHFLKECHLKILPILSIVALIGLSIISNLHVQSWFGLMTAASVYAVIFAVISYKFLFNDYEKSLLKSVLKIR